MNKYYYENLFKMKTKLNQLLFYFDNARKLIKNEIKGKYP